MESNLCYDRLNRDENTCKFMQNRKIERTILLNEK